MKILHLSNTAGRLGGGVSEVVHALLYYQFKLGYRSVLWFMGYEKQKDEIADDNEIDKTRLTALGSSFFISPFVFKKLKKIIKDDFVIHQHGIFLPISFLSLLARKKSKLIISPHGYLEEEKMKVSFYKKKLVLTLFEKRNLKNSHCLVACSNKEAISLRDFGLTQPIVILPNGTNDKMIKAVSSSKSISEFKKRYNIGLNSKVLLFLSRIHPFKGLQLFLESVLSIEGEFRKNNWEFIIAGNDELNHERDLKLFVEENGMGDIVKFIGPQYGQDKINTFDSADCFVLPSKGENFGIVVCEALARGLPVIATKGTPWRELETANCGWWTERSKQGFVSTLKDLFSKDKNLLTKMGERGISIVENKYTWSNISKQSIQIYKWVLSDFSEEYKKGFTLFEEDH